MIIQTEIENSSNFDLCPTTIPFFENLFAGISKTLYGLSSTKQTHKKKSIGFNLLRLNTHQPDCSFLTGLPRFSFRLYKLQDLTSTFLPSQSKSASEPLNFRCSAPSSLAPYSSHLKPIPVSVFQKSGLLLKEDLAFGLQRIKEARLLHKLEQYFVHFFCRISGTSLLQNKHFMYSLYMRAQQSQYVNI